MNIAFFHGLESSANSSKSVFLHKNFVAFTPAMNYYDENLFDETLSQLKNANFDLLVGSSMGGYFAYHLSTFLNLPTLLFNPAFVDRSFEPIVHTGTFQTPQTIIIGENDDVIIPQKSILWIENNIKLYSFYLESMGHRTPIEVFEKWVFKSMNEML
jgi:predicted esterase YcpF (UPF0227 family)